MSKTKVLVNGLWVEKPVKFGSPNWRTKVTTPPPPANPIPAMGMEKTSTAQSYGPGTNWQTVNGMTLFSGSAGSVVNNELRIPTGHDSTAVLFRAQVTALQSSGTNVRPWRVYINNGSGFQVAFSMAERAFSSAKEETFTYTLQAGSRIYLSFQSWSGGNTSVPAVGYPNYVRFDPV